MNFGDNIQRALRVVQLDRLAIDATARDESAFTLGVATIALGGAAYAIGTLNVPIGLLTHAVGWLLVAVLFGGALHLLAVLAFRGQGAFVPFFRAFSHTFVAQWITAVPMLGPPVLWLACLWQLVVTVVILERLYGLDRTRAVLCVGILTAAVLLLLLVFGGLALLLAFLLRSA